MKKLLLAMILLSSVADAQINLIDKVKQKNDGTFYLLDASDITFDAAGEQTISSGDITQPDSGFAFTIDTQSDAASDDLDSLRRSTKGPGLLLVRPAHTDRTVVLKHGTGNIKTADGADLSLDTSEKMALLFYNGAFWLVYPSGGGGAATDTTSLSSRINLKLTGTDTASLSSRINLKLTGTDTASLSGRINAKPDSGTVLYWADTSLTNGPTTNYDLSVLKPATAVLADSAKRAYHSILSDTAGLASGVIFHTHLAGTIAVHYGTLTSGIVDSTRILDGKVVTVTEANGANPMQVEVDFGGVDAITRVLFYGRYQGTASHEVDVEIYNDDLAAWEQLGQLATSTTNAWHSWGVFNSAAYVGPDDSVKVRFRHLGTGISSHKLYIDYMVVDDAQGGGGGVTSHSQLSGLAHADHPTSAVIGLQDSVAVWDADSARAAGGVPWSGVTSKPDSFRAAWKADTLTGDVDVMRADSLHVGETGNFIVDKAGVVKMLGNGVSTAGGLGVPAVMFSLYDLDRTLSIESEGITGSTADSPVLVAFCIQPQGDGTGTYNFVINDGISDVTIATIDMTTTTQFCGSRICYRDAFVKFFNESDGTYRIGINITHFEP
jgi:hypothetical protein